MLSNFLYNSSFSSPHSSSATTGAFGTTGASGTIGASGTTGITGITTVASGSSSDLLSDLGVLGETADKHPPDILVKSSTDFG